jgi:hypothetical protein
MEIAGYDDPKAKIRNAVLFKMNPAAAVGIPPEEIPLPAMPTEMPDESNPQ